MTGNDSNSIDREVHLVFWVLLGSAICGFLMTGVALIQIDFHDRFSIIPERNASGRHYIFRWMLFCGASVLAFILWRKRCVGGLRKLVKWRKEGGAEQRRPRAIIFWTVIFICATYLGKFFWGIWFPGICGWTYEKVRPGLMSEAELPQEISISNLSLIQKRALLGGVTAERYVGEPGFLRGEVLLLEFESGELLPANEELFEFVFPAYVIKSNPEAVIQVLRENLDRRREQKRFVLPLSASYPPHSPYNWVDYADYPPGEALSAIQWWTVIIHTSGDLRHAELSRRLEVVSEG